MTQKNSMNNHSHPELAGSRTGFGLVAAICLTGAVLMGCGGGSSSTDGSVAAAAASDAGGGSTGTSAAPGTTTAGEATAATDGSAGGTLEIGIAGTEAGVSYDVLNVGGQAQLAGTLSVVFADGFTPVASQKFTVVRAAGGFSGRFGSVVNNKAATLSLSQDATNFYVTVTR